MGNITRSAGVDDIIGNDRKSARDIIGKTKFFEKI